MTTLTVGNIMVCVECDENVAQIIYDSLSYTIKGAEHAARAISKKYGRPVDWSGVKSFFDRRRRLFLTGLLGKVKAGLTDGHIPFRIVDARIKPPASMYGNDAPLKGIELYDYQERVITDFKREHRGVARLATGAGKTEVAIALTRQLGLPTLFMTHRINLLNQTARRYVARCPELEKHIGILGGGASDPKRITIATVQTLFALVKKHPKQMAEFLGQFQFLIIDEAHRSGARQFYIPASLCHNAFYRLALTATPFMGGDDEDDLFLMGITDDIFSRVTNAELIARGILARPLFKFFHVYAPDLGKFHDWRDVYERGIIYNTERNTLISKQTKKLAGMGKKILVIVRERLHGELLTGLIATEGVRTIYCDGRNSAQEREKALDMLRKDKMDAIVATNIFDEGIDVHDINAIVLTAGTKSAPAIFQRTGRAMRKKKDGENYCIILDFIDHSHRILYEHSMARYETIKGEPGFTIL